jgi:hypothetical protein
MYHKVKNTLVGLSMVAAFMVGGLVLGEPVTPPQPIQAHSAMSPEVAVAVGLLQIVAAIAAAESAPATTELDDAALRAARDARARASARLRLELGMPYYSFGAMLPRRGES